MSPINDNDLILYFYRDGLDAERIREIDDALFTSVDLRSRYTQLQQILRQTDVETAMEPDAGFNERIWQRVSQRMDAERLPRISWRQRLGRFARPPQLAFAATCLLMLAIGGGYYAGRNSVPSSDEKSNAMAAHVLDAYVAEHLRTTEGLLLTAVNNDSAQLGAGNRDVAAALVESNRMYALAAARSGNTRLAEFLRQLEPVLLELANQPENASVQSIDGLRDYLRKTDLLFQVRATEARIDNAGKQRI